MRISVHVVPGSKRESVESGEPWCVHVCSQPVDGKANQELIDVLSGYFRVRRCAVHIVRGQASRNKIVEVEAADGCQE